ncbi:MAG: tRNA (adenosine(37)-N6)-threonylcarbamoyltransferase complex ATPase subunit type 1 TsaE [Erysipelotrichaceae bacterium]|nr:tRNA (adenosine(37)-N6)-threonylcarbamoyltransferase complex ATPase subunit type 1 TsaE [Erysipelotrichaceae bacterium]
MKKTIIVSDLSETASLGRRIGELVEEGMVIIMSGDLGAGKTTLTQAIGKGLGITRTISSPTFTILKIYKGRMPLYHIDAYRLEGLHQDLGFEEMIEDDGLTVIEWPMYIEELIPEERLSIVIHLEDDKRIFEFEAVGKRYEALLEAL